MALQKVVHVVARPIRSLGYLIHDKLHLRIGLPKWWKRHYTKIALCVLVVFLGAFLATLKQSLIPHFIQDGIAYTIHGIGAAPLIERLLIFLSVAGD